MVFFSAELIIHTLNTVLDHLLINNVLKVILVQFLNTIFFL
jgi:hypothetical protein